MSENADSTTSNQLTLSLEAFPARTYRWLDAAKDWLEAGAGSGQSLHECLRAFARDGLSSKMSPVFCPLTRGETWEYCAESWRNSAIGGPIGCLTLNTSEWPNDAVVCSLSEILETDPVPTKYFLSAKAARGILRRAERRSRELPPLLLKALLQVAESANQDEDEKMM